METLYVHHMTRSRVRYLSCRGPALWFGVLVSRMQPLWTGTCSCMWRHRCHTQAHAAHTRTTAPLHPPLLLLSVLRNADPPGTSGQYHTARRTRCGSPGHKLGPPNYRTPYSSRTGPELVRPDSPGSPGRVPAHRAHSPRPPRFRCRRASRDLTRRVLREGEPGSCRRSDTVPGEPAHPVPSF